MNRYLEAVKEFHENFDHPVNGMNDEISLKLRQLRIKLIFEELEELAEATACSETFSNLCRDGINKVKDDSVKRDKKEEMDALCDLQYVLSGAVLAMGHHEHFEQAFEEVQRSNMSKACNTAQEAKDTQQWYLDRDGTESEIVGKGDKLIVLRKGDKKILKNKYYSEAKLDDFV